LSIVTRTEAGGLIAKCKPHVVSSDVSLADGSWVSILHTADAMFTTLSVAVIAPRPDTKLYVSVVQRGPFDFIAAPFERGLVDFVVRPAPFDTFSRREEAERAPN
jgi:DNA-binding NtrC family response regulator